MEAFRIISRDDYLYAIFICEPVWSLIAHEKASEFISCLRTLRALRSMVARNQRPSNSSNRQIIENSILLKRSLNRLYSKPLKDDPVFTKLLKLKRLYHDGDDDDGMDTGENRF